MTRVARRTLAAAAIVAGAAALGLAWSVWSAGPAGGRGQPSGPGARLPAGRAPAEGRLVLVADGLDWSAAIAFLPAPDGKALLYTIELVQRAGPRPGRYRVTASLPFAAQVCRREGPPGATAEGPWTSPAPPASEPARAPVRLPACRLDLHGRSLADGFALVRENPLVLQIEWQVGSEIRVEVIEAGPE